MPGRRRRRNEELRNARDLIGGALGASPLSTSIRDQVAELGGTRAVAALTGRSERTIRRWAHNDRVPIRGGAADGFDQAVNQNRNTTTFRRSQINHRRDTRMRNHGATITFSGIAGPLTDSPGASIKRRNIQWHLTGNAMSAILDAFYAQGNDAAVDVLGQAMAAEYMGSSQYGWVFQDTANLRFLRHNF